MSMIARFAAYAAAFEKAFESDDWSEVESYFQEDAVYAAGGDPFPTEVVGRAAIITYFRTVLDAFDRRFAHRTLKLLEGPRETSSSVWIRGSAAYDAPGVPDIEFELEEEITFDGDMISRLEDRYDADTLERLRAYIAAHGETLGLSPVI